MKDLSSPVGVADPKATSKITKGSDTVSTARGLADQPIISGHLSDLEVQRNGVHSSEERETTPPVESPESELDLRKNSYTPEESYNYKYQSTDHSNPSDIESDAERDDHSRKSPGSDYFNDKNIDIAQRLPSSVGQFATTFSAEEARLRFSLESSQIKDRFQHLSSSLAEEAHRRFSLPADAHRPDIPGLTSSHSSPPISPDSNGLNRSPYTPYKGQGQGTPRSLDQSFDEQDSYAFQANIKEGLYFCHLCSFSGTTQKDFDLHMTVHFEHVCPHCDYKSRTEGRLKRHIKDFHTEDSDGFGTRTMPGRPKIFRCKQCEYSTTDKVEFWAHSRTHIKEDKLLQCPRCPFVTEYKHHLEYHLRNHFGSKPFKCPKCNYACVNKSMLNSHMKSHTNVYQYRCADCTYATKYCHSLKLHLRKYNHKPAAVLNSDGSLPQGVDATASGLSLLAKRGPPRGPRGPRKDKLDGMSPGFPQMPQTMPGPMPGFPGMISPFWPMLHGLPNGLNGMPSPMGLPRFNGHLPGLPGFPMKSEEMMSPPLSSHSLKCNFCGFAATSREVLTSHVMKVHAGENQDLFSIFGLSSESILEDKHRMNAINALKSPQKPSRMSMFGMNPETQPQIKKEVMDELQSLPKSNGRNGLDLSHDRSPLPYKFPSEGIRKDEGIDILKQMTLKFGSGPVEKENKARPAGDSPLDLTKPRSPPLSYSMTTPSHMRKPEYDEHEQSSGESSVLSIDVVSPPPRKRSRKGQAFKLDTLCRKLQEQRSHVYNSDEDLNVDNDEVYSSDLLPVEAEDASPIAEYDRESEEDNGSLKMDIDANENETNGTEGTETKDIKVSEETSKEIVDEALKELHSSIAILNAKNAKDSEMMKLPVTENNGEVREEPTSLQPEVNREPVKQRSPSPTYNRRKPIPSAIQRGTDIAWKLFNSKNFGDPVELLKNGNNNHNLELSTLDKKLWLNTNDCMSDLTKGDYECPHCKIAFGDCIMYTMHMGYHGYKDPYKCNMCGDTCKDRVEFFLHIARAAHN